MITYKVIIYKYLFFKKIHILCTIRELVIYTENIKESLLF